MENINQATSQNVESARQLEETAHQMDQLGRALLQLVQSGSSKNSRSY
jgi:methyl-accepting chemotaxis protein